MATSFENRAARRATPEPRWGRLWRMVRNIRRSALFGGLMVFVVVLAIVAAPVLTSADPGTLSLYRLQGPSWAHPMGTDDLGRDFFARVLYGGRLSLMIGLFSAGVAVTLGMAFGLLAGFFGGVVDDLLMRLTEIFQILPRLLVAVVVVTLFGSSLTTLILVIGFLGWPGTARIIRARTSMLRDENFIAAAYMSGASWHRIILRQVVPIIFPYFLVSCCLGVGTAILAESFLSFLGLGIPDRPGWGQLLQQGQLYLQQAWWLTTFPGLALALLIMGLNLAGDQSSYR
ncbi:MAG: ABC-type dipeptide/oligopeptide/nickel transport system, permease component [Bradyrhizobium sp.]|nr:ABC-type dipeptide/oligopeptide/nickel transport system, permease component [Bradyrhizobium sp.]